MTSDWGALFHAARALPRSDTIDTVDTLAAGPGGVTHSVNSVNSVNAGGRIAPAPSPPMPPQPVGWLTSIARSIRAVLADGAVRAADEDGWLVLVRPDGRHTVVAPNTVAELAAHGLLPPLPPAVAVVPEPDPIEAAEREAVRSMPPMPPEGSPERAEADRRQADEIAALLTAALCRPPGWSDVRSVPPPGAWCSCCGRGRRKGGRWWREAQAPTGWRCATCHPPDHLPPGGWVEVAT